MTAQPEPGTAPATPLGTPPASQPAETPAADGIQDHQVATDADAPDAPGQEDVGESDVVLTTDPVAQREDSLVDPTNS